MKWARTALTPQLRSECLERDWIHSLTTSLRSWTVQPQRMRGTSPCLSWGKARGRAGRKSNARVMRAGDPCVILRRMASSLPQGRLRSSHVVSLQALHLTRILLK